MGQALRPFLWAPPPDLDATAVRGFLTHLVEDRNLSASTQQQALSALLFLYRNVVGRPLEVLASLQGVHRLVGLLLYGSGLRLMECLTLRVKDLDLERGELTVRRGRAGGTG